jgi:hypothetical protein
MPGDSARQKLVDALLAASLRGRRKGRPNATWRMRLRLPMIRIMNDFPDEKLSDLAQTLKDIEDHARIRTGKAHLDLPTVRSIEIWLSNIRGGHLGVGRKPLA